MSIERVYYCEGPDCDIPRDEPVPDDDRLAAHARTAAEPPHLPSGFIETRQTHPDGHGTHHFCSWGCVMKFAAEQPVPTIIRMDEP